MAKLADFERQLRKLGGDLERAGLLEIQHAVGKQANTLVDKAVRSTPVRTAGRSLSDQTMSGFKAKGVATPIAARYAIDRNTMRITPRGNAAGRMAILESGRKAYVAGEQRVRKRYTSRKTGQVALRMSTVGRAVGAQTGKQTWTRAAGDIRADYLTVAAETLHKILVRTFGVR